MARSSVSSDSSSDSRDRKRRKLSKKHKKTKKADKKHKRSKSKKRSKRRNSASSNSDTSNVVIRPTTPSTEDAVFGAALPPNLLASASAPKDAEQRPLIGPVIPSDIILQSINQADEHGEGDSNASSTDEDSTGGYGPVPVPDGDAASLTATQVELEERALKLRLAAIDGISTEDIDQTVREEWMLELPEVGLKTGLAALSNMKRTFHQGKERPDFSDRSSWTKTPNSGNQKPTTSKSTAEMMKSVAQAKYERERDAEQERIAKKHKKKHKREESLVEIHQKKLKKEQKAKEKELAAAGVMPERRPFSRDVDLKLNKIDSNQTKQIVDKAKILDSKFSSGNKKYL